METAKPPLFKEVTLRLTAASGAVYNTKVLTVPRDWSPRDILESESTYRDGLISFVDVNGDTVKLPELPWFHGWKLESIEAVKVING